jgi:hypothetical protein
LLNTCWKPASASFANHLTLIRNFPYLCQPPFLTLAFSLPFTLAALIVDSAQTPKVSDDPTYQKAAVILIGFATSILFGVLWRKYFKNLTHSILSKLNVSWANDDPPALITISASTNYSIWQLLVETKDKHWFESLDIEKYATAPYGPFLLGPTGDVALYVDQITLPDGTEKEQRRVLDPLYGDKITYIPTGEIRRITMRLKT